jgi:Ran GTPase-activating protein (RanGAP) involved in mRNA processing and transport
VLIEHLYKYNNLKKLNLNKNYMGIKFAVKLKEIMAGGDKNLTELYLSWNEFNSKAVKAILEAVH